MNNEWTFMYEKFTDRARKVMQLANQEAQRFNHEYIGTEHILLGLVKLQGGVAYEVLKSFKIDIRRIRLEIEKLVQSGPDLVTMGKLPQTPRTKKVVEYAMEEATNLNHNYVGTEHLLLGLLREGENVAAIVLTALGLDLEKTRLAIFDLLGAGKHDERIPPRGSLFKDALATYKVKREESTIEMSRDEKLNLLKELLLQQSQLNLIILNLAKTL